jgi:hypothetical protein
MFSPHDLNCRRRFTRSLVAAAITTPMAAFFGRTAFAQNKHDMPMPGAPASSHGNVLDTAANSIQLKGPLDAMSEFLNGFHFYADDIGRQVEANHFCTHLTEDLHQCVIYDSNQSNAKLIGIEYIVSERAFKSLPDEEKRLWHSHSYEVKSGELIAPGVSEIAEHAFMKDLVTTYGKTWHTWQIDRYPNLPIGIPQLMMGFIKDGQVKQQMVENRDKRLNKNTQILKSARDDIPWPNIDTGANAWRDGTAVQLILQELPMKNLRK